MLSKSTHRENCLEKFNQTSMKEYSLVNNTLSDDQILKLLGAQTY
jgi:hypothetical protein